MRAIIRNIGKSHLPHNRGKDGRDRVHITTEVDFVDDAGEVVLNQTYAHLPEHFDGAYFQRQAAAMQSDIESLKDRAAVEAAREEEHKPADDAIRKFKLDFADLIQLRDETNNA